MGRVRVTIVAVEKQRVLHMTYCRENQNTHFMLVITFFVENCAFLR